MDDFKEIICGIIVVTFYKSKDDVQMVILSRTDKRVEMTLSRFCDILVRPDIRQEIEKRGWKLNA